MALNYNGTIYRPPIEAYALLLLVMEGCSHNRCRFCNMYKGVKFRMLSAEDIEAWLEEIRRVNDLYVGVESGLEDVLKNLNKGNSVEDVRDGKFNPAGETEES